MRKIAIILLVVAVGISFARARRTSGKRLWDIKPIKINDLWMWNSNFGEFGQQEGDRPGGEWPGGSGHMYNFGSGIWIGCLQGDNLGDTLVTMGYNPNSGTGEMVPGLIEQGTGAYSDPNVVVYAYPDLWPPPKDIFPMAPQEAFSLADQWMCFNDADPSYHDPNDTRPIGLEFYMSVYGWNYESNRDMIFYRVTIKNCSGESLYHMYLGICDDPDIGSAGDDIVRVFIDTTFTETIGGQEITYHVDNVGFDYDSDGQEAGWDSVGCIAFDYLQSPYALHDGIDNDRAKDSIFYPSLLPDSLKDEEEIDSAKFTAKVTNPKEWDGDGDGVMDWRDPSMIEQFGMTAFMRFTLEIDPQTDAQRYLTMKGIDYRTLDSIGFMRDDNTPDDKRFIQCTGPFEMAPEDTIVVTFAVICAGFHHPGGAGADSMHLVRRDAIAQFIFDMNWLLPGPPPSPKVTAIPGDNMVTLVWDNTPEITPDPYYEIASNPNSSAYDSLYVEYDFQGYKVYRSVTGKVTDWVLLAQCDLIDTVDTSVIKDTTTPESVRTMPLNTGLFHSFVDTGNSKLGVYRPRNGITYYYAVTSYDFNATTIEGSLKNQFSLESGKSAIAVAPRREPANYIPPTCSIVTVNVSDHPATELTVHLPVPMDVKDNLFVLKFYGVTCDTTSGSKDPVYWYTLTKNGEQIYPDSGRASFVLPFGDSSKVAFSITDGTEIMFKTRTDKWPSDTAFIHFEVKSGSYPVESLIGGPTSSDFYNAWAFTGADYKIVWHEDPNGKTITVTDLLTNETIPYKPFKPKDETLKQDAYSWCFLNKYQPSIRVFPTQYLADSTPIVHICGGYFELCRGDTVKLIDRIKDGDEWIVYSRRLRTVPYNCEYQIFTTPASFIRDSTITLNVKVVPNPYIVTNEWQQTHYNRKLKFINLPDKCTIRIYTVAGDLIKTIYHDNTYKQPNDAGGDEWWDILTDNDQLPASGVYLFHVDSDVGEQVGKFAIIIGR